MTAQYVWGVDVAISRLAFALAEIDGDGLGLRTLLTRSDATEGERLGHLDRQLRIYAGQLQGEFPAAVVWVEQPSGRHRALQLTYCTGVIQAALFEALRVPVWTIPSSAWKVRALGAGRGNATKPQVAAWAASLGYEPASQDEADAIGIAVAGRAMLQSGTWKAAA